MYELIGTLLTHFVVTENSCSRFGWLLFFCKQAGTPLPATDVYGSVRYVGTNLTKRREILRRWYSSPPVFLLGFAETWDRTYALPSGEASVHAVSLTTEPRRPTI